MSHTRGGSARSAAVGGPVMSCAPWSGHIHGFAIGCDSLDPAAQRQVDAYRARKEGLESRKRDTGPKVRFQTFAQYLSEGRLPDLLPR